MQPVSIVEQTGLVNVVIRVAIEKEGKYFLVQEGKEYVRGLWSFPGGKVEVGETLSAAALREIREETGMEIKLQGVIGMQHRLWDEKDGFSLEIDFLATVITMPDVLPISEEVLSSVWKSVAEIEGMHEAGQLRHAGQMLMVQMLKKKNLLPLSSLIEVHTPAPKIF